MAEVLYDADPLSTEHEPNDVQVEIVYQRVLASKRRLDKLVELRDELSKELKIISRLRRSFFERLLYSTIFKGRRADPEASGYNLLLSDERLLVVSEAVKTCLSAFKIAQDEASLASVRTEFLTAAPERLDKLDEVVADVFALLPDPGEAEQLRVPFKIYRSRRSVRYMDSIVLIAQTLTLSSRRLGEKLERRCAQLEASAKQVLDVPKTEDVAIRRESNIYKRYFNSVSKSIPTPTVPLQLGSKAVPLWQYVKCQDSEMPILSRSGELRDGYVFTEEDFTQVEDTLQRFQTAYISWREENQNLDLELIPQVDKLLSMSRLCLLLKYMDCLALFDHALASDYRDTGLPLKTIEDFQKAFGPEHAGDTDFFLDQQYRVVRDPQWDDTDKTKPVELRDREPLPFRSGEQRPKQGGFSRVIKVKDMQQKDTFWAHKRTRGAEGTKHLETDYAYSRGLDPHRHLMGPHKAYKRGGDEYGFLMPHADHTLRELLVKMSLGGFCTRDPEKWTRGKLPDNEVVWVRDALLLAFGCLSHSLAHIHCCHLRHRDIKPDNILLRYNSEIELEDVFLWSDFGLAWDARPGQTASTESDAARDRSITLYSAPEFAASILGTSDDALEECSDDKLADQGQQHCASTPCVGGDSHPQTAYVAHSTAEDIFALGAVFIDIISVLTGDLADPNDSGGAQRFQPYYENLQDLNDWIDERISTLQSDTWQSHHDVSLSFASMNLASLLDLARKMIRKTPSYRPTAPQVMARVLAIDEEGLQDRISKATGANKDSHVNANGYLHFCSSCLQSEREAFE